MPRPRPQNPVSRGFTLVEILVVITIIAIVVSVATMSLRLADDHPIDRELSRFVSLVEVARDESLLQGREYGLEIFETGYRFVELDPFTNQWAEVVGDDLLRPRALPEMLEMALYLEGQIIELDREGAPIPFRDPDEEEDDDRGVEDYLPHVFVFSSGDTTPFELVLRETFGDDERRLRSDAFGNVDLIEDELL